MTTEQTLSPPIAPTDRYETLVHGHTRVDDYFWMRQKDDPRVREYLNAENAYTDAVMAPTEELQHALYDEMLCRIQETDASAPTRRPPYLYYTRTEEGKQYGIACRRLDETDAIEEVLLDENVLAEGHDYFALGVFSVTDDHRMAAYSVDVTGAESYTMHVKNLATGELLEDTLVGTYYSLAWTNDGSAFYYTTHDDAMRPHRVWLHRLGTPQTEDVTVAEEDDERFFIRVTKTRSKRFILVSSESMTTTEVSYADASSASTTFSVIEPRRQDVEYYVEHQDERFLIMTNDTGRNFRLVEAPVGAPDRTRWVELVPHRAAVKLEDVEAFAGHVVREEREDGLPRFAVSDVATGAEHVIEQPEAAFGLYVGANAVYETPVFRFNYTSLTTPTSAVDYDMSTRDRVVVKQEPVLGGFRSSDYVAERIWAAASDGTRVAISLVHRAGTVLDGSNPCALYGYGSYGATMDPNFRSARLSLLDRGFVFAIAHIRGGGELGKPWHDDGRLLKKRNTFTDFIACAEHLVAEGYTSPDRLVIEGGSAGGLLMGAVTNMRPDLFAAVVAHVPFVDAVNTILDPTLPLTVTEYEEWGDPGSSEEVYRYMSSYAPYDNVEAKDYPHILVLSGLNDPRVSYWEPTKWVAKLRAMKTDDRRLLLRTRMDSGHGGPSGRYDAIRETAFVYAFVLDVLGLRA